MGLIWRYFSAIASRLIFVVHSIYSLRETLSRIYVGDEEKANNSAFWSLTIILGFVVIEGAYTLIIRKGNEYKFFWPSGFIYVLIMIAITCILESFLMEEEIKCFQTTPAILTNSTINMEMKKLCNLALSTKKDDQKLRAAVEIGMLGALVMGRWLLPRGELTRDQLSALLLNFIGNGADCIEFLNTWNDFPVLRNRDVTNTVLVLYSFSMLQFAVITTKTTNEYNEEESSSSDVGCNLEASTKKSEIPIYLQKLIKNKEINKNSYSMASIPTTLYSARVLASTYRNKNKNGRISNYRARAITEDRVFTNVIDNEKSSRFYSKQSSDHSVEPVARYLQGLARCGKWDEFSELLKQARNQGFSTSSLLSSPKNHESDEKEDKRDIEKHENKLFKKLKCFKKIDQDIFQAVILMFSLEIPYLLARIVFAVVYNVSSTTMVFYTTKNIVMVVFLIYRLWVIHSVGENEVENTNRDPMNIK